MGMRMSSTIIAVSKSTKEILKIYIKKKENKFIYTIL